ncbi:MAG: hypothetical protein WAV47_24395, partial [Blastocatellia bacterium]
MMNIKKAVFMAVLVLAIAALAVPLVGLRAAAAGSAAPAKGVSSAPKAAPTSASRVVQQKEVTEDVQTDNASAGKISAETLRALGIKRVANPGEVSKRI